jgi:hypothetical protein
MRRTRSIIIIFALLITLSAVSVQDAAGEDNPEPVVLLSKVGAGDIGVWFERALNNDRPRKLVIHVRAETSIWDASIYSNDHIRLYLKALKEVEVVEISPTDGLWDDALEVTYTFHMTDGNDMTFLFQEGRVCINPQNNEHDLIYPVIGTGGMDYLLGVYGIQ